MACFRGKCNSIKTIKLSPLRPPVNITPKCFVYVQPMRLETSLKIIVADEFDDVLDIAVVENIEPMAEVCQPTTIFLLDVGVVTVFKYSYFPDVPALSPTAVCSCPLRFSMEEIAFFGTEELGRLLVMLVKMERSAFAALFHGKRTTLGFIDLDALSGKKLPKVRHLTNAYGLTPVRRRLVQYLVAQSASCREMSRWFSIF